MVAMSFRAFIIKVLVFTLIKPPFGGRHSTTKCSYKNYIIKMVLKQANI